MKHDIEYPRGLDRRDALAGFREEFVVDDPETIYMDGNSLGRLPKRTFARLQNAVESEWGKRLVRGWNEGWYDAPQRVGAKIAKLIGAREDEVIVGDSTSVNFYKLVSAALSVRPTRHQIVTEAGNFPTDSYILQGIVRARGKPYRLTIVESADAVTIPTAAVIRAIDAEECALVTLSHTSYRSGYVHEMRAITEAAHRAGALVLWDLSHSVGAVEVELNKANADFAVGCTYKYLNGGPGAPAFLYVRRDLQAKLANPIQGWFGQQDQFAMRDEYAPAEGIRRFMTGTPPMLSLLAVETGVDLVLEAGMERLRAKSVAQTEYLIALWEEFLAPLGVTLNSPRDPQRRGSHVSLGHAEGLRIDRALIEEMGVIPDFRYPDNIRFGIAPLYTRFEDVYRAMERLRRVIAERIYEKYSVERPTVT